METAGGDPIRHSDESGGISRRHVIRFVSASVVLAGLPSSGRSEGVDDRDSEAAWEAASRVTDVETGRPVEGAEVVLERAIRGAAPATPPAWLGLETIRTDADGRFRLEFSAEQVATLGFCIELRIRHPDYISRKSYRTLLADLIREERRGEPPFFATVQLERGLEYTGQVVVPGGRPAAGLPYWFECWELGTIPRQHRLTMDTAGRDGRRRPHPDSDAEDARPGDLPRAAEDPAGPVRLFALSALLGHRHGR